MGAPCKEGAVLTGKRSSAGGTQAQRVCQTASHIDPTNNTDLGILLDNIRAKVDQESRYRQPTTGENPPLFQQQRRR